jgi:hypothetical protein
MVARFKNARAALEVPLAAASWAPPTLDDQIALTKEHSRLFDCFSRLADRLGSLRLYLQRLPSESGSFAGSGEAGWGVHRGRTRFSGARSVTPVDRAPLTTR